VSFARFERRFLTGGLTAWSGADARIGNGLTVWRLVFRGACFPLLDKRVPFPPGLAFQTVNVYISDGLRPYCGQQAAGASKSAAFVLRILLSFQYRVDPDKGASGS